MKTEDDVIPTEKWCFFFVQLANCLEKKSGETTFLCGEESPISNDKKMFRKGYENVYQSLVSLSQALLNQLPSGKLT